MPIIIVSADYCYDGRKHAKFSINGGEDAGGDDTPQGRVETHGIDIRRDSYDLTEDMKNVYSLKVIHVSEPTSSNLNPEEAPTRVIGENIYFERDERALKELNDTLSGNTKREAEEVEVVEPTLLQRVRHFKHMNEKPAKSRDLRDHILMSNKRYRSVKAGSSLVIPENTLDDCVTWALSYARQHTDILSVEVFEIIDDVEQYEEHKKKANGGGVAMTITQRANNNRSNKGDNKTVKLTNSVTAASIAAQLDKCSTDGLEVFIHSQVTMPRKTSRSKLSEADIGGGSGRPAASAAAAHSLEPIYEAAPPLVPLVPLAVVAIAEETSAAPQQPQSHPTSPRKPQPPGGSKPTSATTSDTTASRASSRPGRIVSFNDAGHPPAIAQQQPPPAAQDPSDEAIDENPEVQTTNGRDRAPSGDEDDTMAMQAPKVSSKAVAANDVDLTTRRSTVKPKIKNSRELRSSREAKSRAQLLAARENEFQRMLATAHKEFDATTARFGAATATAEQKMQQMWKDAEGVFNTWSNFDSNIKESQVKLSQLCREKEFMFGEDISSKMANAPVGNAAGLCNSVQQELAMMNLRAKTELHDKHMERLSKVGWFLTAIARLRESAKKSANPAPICCFQFLTVLKFLFIFGFTFDSEELFYRILENTVVDAEDHSKLVVHRLLKSAREAVGIGAEKFFHYLKSKNILPCVDLQMQVRAIEQRRMRSMGITRRTMMMSSQAMHPGGGHGVAITTSSSIVSSGGGEMLPAIGGLVGNLSHASSSLTINGVEEEIEY